MFIDRNSIFPQNNCPPKEPNEGVKDAPIKEKKEEKSPKQISLKEGENILMDFLQRKKNGNLETQYKDQKSNQKNNKGKKWISSLIL